MEMFLIRILLLLQYTKMYTFVCKQKCYSKNLKLDKNVFTSIFYNI